MKCPICQVDLVMTERQGIEIDYCPQCRGIWLDRGELDKIIEKSVAANHSPVSSERPGVPVSGHAAYYDKHDDHHSDYGHGYGKKRRKESLLGELFDF